MVTPDDSILSALWNSPQDDEARALAACYAPVLRFDAREPFLPLAAGYTIFRHTGASPSFQRGRQIELVPEGQPPASFAIEYAIWWDWGIGHLLVHTYLSQQAFEPSGDFSQVFRFVPHMLVPWPALCDWMPVRVNACLDRLAREIQPADYRFLRVGHRGAAAHAPDNTLLGFRRAAALGADMFGSPHLDAVRLAQSVRATYVHPCWERFPHPSSLLTPEWVARVREAELGIICWHEERPEEIAALRHVGVDGICSDAPELLRGPQSKE